MTTEQQLRDRLAGLLDQATEITADVHYAFQDNAARARNFQVRQAAAGAWLASAAALAETLLPDPNTPHRRFIAQETQRVHGGFVQQVRSVADILRAIVIDLDHGLFRSIADNATAMAFDDLLDHADEYLRSGRTDVAGVIGGVAFEDAMRRVRAQRNIEPEEIALEELISVFAKTDVLSAIEAKRARVAAAVRTSATHARWDEFKQRDVEDCMGFTRQFISKNLSS